MNKIDFDNLIYFDNAATTKPAKEVLNTMLEVGDKFYANNESAHNFGVFVDNMLNDATEYVAKILSCDKDEIIWTSGATEGNNFSILQSVEKKKRQGNHIITTPMEHPSVQNVMNKLIKLGYEVDYVKVDNKAQVDINDLQNKIRQDTILVSIMFVNNEIGAKQDLAKIGKAIKEKNNNIIFHVDAVQGFGKYEIKPKKMNIDLLTTSAHKIHGPKGVGFVYKNKNLLLEPFILGGGQQKNMRSGTVNTQGILAYKKAIELAYENLTENTNHLLDLRNSFIDRINQLNDDIKDIYLNTEKSDDFAMNIVSVNFKNVRAEVLLHSLEEYNICVSAGSACSSKDIKLSNTLKAIDIPKDLQGSTIRFSFSRYNTKEQIDKCIELLKDIVPKLRKYGAKH